MQGVILQDRKKRQRLLTSYSYNQDNTLGWGNIGQNDNVFNVNID